MLDLDSLSADNIHYNCRRNRRFFWDILEPNLTSFLFRLTRKFKFPHAVNCPRNGIMKHIDKFQNESPPPPHTHKIDWSVYKQYLGNINYVKPVFHSSVVPQMPFVDKL